MNYSFFHNSFSQNSLVRLYFHSPVLLQFFLGIPSGLPLALTAGLLSAWLFEEGISKETIGIFAAIATPYSLKFLWSPLLDGFTIPYLGKRRGWMLITQLMMALCLALMGLSDPSEQPLIIGILAFFLAFFSASHDIAKDAYRVEILPVAMQGAGSALFVLGYRVGNNLISAVGALYLAYYFGWQNAYLIMAAIMLALCLTLLNIKEPDIHNHNQSQKLIRMSTAQWLTEYAINPFFDFLKRPQAIEILLFIILYRMADAFLGIMAYPFYLELGFSKIEIANVGKLYGLAALAVGSILGGIMVFRLGVIKSLWIGGIAASISNLAFIWQAHVGAELYALALTIGLDNISGGLATTALIAYMGSLMNLRFTATQFALLSSLSAVGRTWLGTSSGYAAEHLGWDGFFILSAIIGIPALVVLWRITATSPPEAATSE